MSGEALLQCPLSLLALGDEELVFVLLLSANGLKTWFCWLYGLLLSLVDKVTNSSPKLCSSSFNKTPSELESLNERENKKNLF